MDLHGGEVFVNHIIFEVDGSQTRLEDFTNWFDNSSDSDHEADNDTGSDDDCMVEPSSSRLEGTIDHEKATCNSKEKQKKAKSYAIQKVCAWLRETPQSRSTSKAESSSSRQSK